jgi:hypothetical protein
MALNGWRICFLMAHGGSASPKLLSTFGGRDLAIFSAFG